LFEGLVIGKKEKENGVDLPLEVLIEPLGLITQGAYVARVASRVLLQKNWKDCEAERLGNLVPVEIVRGSIGL
jgi:hypothetical protein